MASDIPLQPDHEARLNYATAMTKAQFKIARGLCAEMGMPQSHVTLTKVAQVLATNFLAEIVRVSQRAD